MPQSIRKGPCSQCPFRRRAAAGWLGSSGPAQFLIATVGAALGGTLQESAMPCHVDIDYADEDWQVTQYPDSSVCAGGLQMLNNANIEPLDPAFRDACAEVGTNPKVFGTGQEFYDHHASGPQVWTDQPFAIQSEDLAEERLERAGILKGYFNPNNKEDDSGASNG